MTAPPNGAAQPLGQAQALPHPAAAVSGQTAGSLPGTGLQSPSETDGRQPRLCGNRSASNAGQPARVQGGVLLAAASCLLLLLAAAQGYVSFRAQYAFVDHAKRARVPSVLEALGLDTGAVIFALLALSLARHGRSGTVERVLNVACALGSLTMNLLAANLTSPRSITVWVLPSVLYALASDRLIAVVRRWVQASDPAAQIGQEGSAWRAFGGLALWMLRLIFDARGTVTGFRRWVLVAAPVAPGTRAMTPIADRPPALLAEENERDAGADRRIEPSSAMPATQPDPEAQTQRPEHDALAHQDLAPGETKRAALDPPVRAIRPERRRPLRRPGQDGSSRQRDRSPDWLPSRYRPPRASQIPG